MGGAHCRPITKILAKQASRRPISSPCRITSSYTVYNATGINITDEGYDSQRKKFPVSLDDFIQEKFAKDYRENAL